MILGQFLKRQSVHSFEVTFAVFCIYSGLAGIMGIGLSSGPLTSILGGWLATVIEVAFAISGAMMFFGIGFGRRDLEAGGLVMVITSLLLRNLTLLMTFGLTWVFVSSYFHGTAFAIACFFRLRKLAKVRMLVEITADGQ